MYGNNFFIKGGKFTVYLCKIFIPHHQFDKN